MPQSTINIITIDENLTCPTCGCARLQPFANSRMQSQCLGCGLAFHTTASPPFNAFDDLLAATNSITEVEFGSLHDQVFAGRGW